jgi:cell shape-determining protein MreC
MDMIDQEINRLKTRQQELTSRIIPDFEHRTQVLYAQILPMAKESAEREHLEEEYAKLSKELTLRSDELISIRHQIEHLEAEKNFRR